MPGRAHASRVRPAELGDRFSRCPGSFGSGCMQKRPHPPPGEPIEDRSTARAERRDEQPPGTGPTVLRGCYSRFRIDHRLLGAGSRFSTLFPRDGPGLHARAHDHEGWVDEFAGRINVPPRTLQLSPPGARRERSVSKAHACGRRLDVRVSIAANVGRRHFVAAVRARVSVGGGHMPRRTRRPAHH